MAKPGPSKPAAAEAKEDPHLDAFVANARRIAAELAEDTAAQLKVQAHYDKVTAEMQKGAAKTRRQAEQ